MFNKNTFSSLLLIGSLLFLFFNDNGIVVLMKKQSIVRKQKSQIEKLNLEKKKLIRKYDQLNILTNPNHIINDHDIIKLNKLRKEKGITLDNEYYYIIEEK